MPTPVLLFIADAIRAGADPRAIRRAADRGLLIRLRRGVYCPRADWDRLDDRGRHLLRVRAVVSQLRLETTLVCGYSAAAVWEIPVLQRWGEEVELLTPYRGGGTLEPGVRRTSARWHPPHASVHAGLPVTSLARTAFDIVLRDGFAGGVATLDGLLRENRMSAETLLDELQSWNPSSGQARLRRAIEFAATASGSYGESLARAEMENLGFPAPELQYQLRDREGSMFADFYWREANLVGEFDGRVKYTDPRYAGDDPAEVVWREKQREDRIRRLGPRVVRILWAHLRDRAALVALLEGAGLRRRHRSVHSDTAPPVSFAT